MFKLFKKWVHRNKVESALLGWDLVDSGKHLDWHSNSKYISIYIYI